MRLLIGLGLFLGLLAMTRAEGPGAFTSGRQRNLFQELLGRTEAETDAKIQAAWQQFTQGDERTQRLFYNVAGEMAYVPDINNEDVRSEGMSYGMMIAVQLNQRREFDRLWKWACTHMRHASGPFRGYFAWHADYQGRQLSAGPAPDGEEWFVMALFFAAHRWAAVRASSTMRPRPRRSCARCCIKAPNPTGGM